MLWHSSIAWLVHDEGDPVIDSADEHDKESFLLTLLELLNLGMELDDLIDRAVDEAEGVLEHVNEDGLFVFVVDQVPQLGVLVKQIPQVTALERRPPNQTLLVCFIDEEGILAVEENFESTFIVTIKGSRSC